MQVQRIAQAISPALLHAVTMGAKSYVLKELQPMTDRLDLAQWKGRIERLELAVASMAAVTAWAQLRPPRRLRGGRPAALRRWFDMAKGLSGVGGAMQRTRAGAVVGLLQSL